MKRVGRVGWAALLLVALVGCGGQPGAGERPNGAAEPPATEPSVSRAAGGACTEEEILALLAPVPGGAVTVHYVLRGPDAATGSLELAVASGGWRVERWRVEYGDGRSLSLEVSASPAVWWLERAGRIEPLRSRPLAPLAAALAGRQPDERARACAALEAWWAELEQARREHPGQLDRVADQACVIATVAGDELCVWEQAQLPLRFTALGVQATAVRIERGVGPDVAALSRVQPAPPPGGDEPDPGRFWAGVLAGDGLAQLGDVQASSWLSDALREPGPAEP